MIAVTLEKPGRFTLAEVEEPAAPEPGEALVQVRRLGVCGTDLHAFRGRQPFFNYPRMLGHELAVEVLEVGEAVKNVRVGDRCAVEPYLNCGSCIACRQGKGNCCTQLKVLGVHTDGGMRPRMILPAAKLHRSGSLGLDALALVEPIGIGAHAVARAALQPGEYVLVIGAGPIGLGVVQMAQAAGAQVVVLDVNERRLQVGREALHPFRTICGPDSAEEQLLAALGGDLPTAVFDATGNPASMNGAFRFVAHGGRLVFVGLFQGDVTFNDPEFHRRELTLLASRNALPADFTRIIGWLEEGRISADWWITHRATIQDDLNDCFNRWLQPEAGVVKALLDVPA